jgi:hypothetical protein
MNHPDVRMPLGRRTRKAVLVAHIVAAGAWIGLDVVMGVLVFTAMLSDHAATQAVSLQALELFAVWPLLTVGMLCLLTGILLGLGTRFGLVRYWWVAVKLALNVVLSGLVLVALRPGVEDAAKAGRSLASGESLTASVGQLGFPPVVSTTALVIATVLAVYKPWGRIRRSRRARAAQGESERRYAMSPDW